MNTKILSFFTFILLSTTTVFAKETEEKNSTNQVEIRFTFERQNMRGSNQYAIWIEDENENLIKTIVVTKFTAQKGWEKRPACTPTWVEKANAGSLSQEELDGITGATPSSGEQVYIWDGTDKNGNKVEAGIYTFAIEATIGGEYNAKFVEKLPIDTENPCSTEIVINPLEGMPENAPAMITNIMVKVIP